MTGYENLKLHCEYMGYYNHGSIENALDMLDLTDVASKPVKNYSLGEKAETLEDYFLKITAEAGK